MACHSFGWPLFAYGVGLAGRSLRMVLVFEAVAGNVSAISVCTIITCGAVVGALMAILAGRLYNGLGPTVLNRTAGTLLLGSATLLYYFPTTGATLFEGTIGLGPTVLNRTAGTLLLGSATLLYYFPTTGATLFEGTIANILICVSFVLSNTAVYRATGAIFSGAPRVTAFSRLNALNSILEIIAPLGVGFLFDLYPEHLSAALGLFACLALLLPRTFPSAHLYPNNQMRSFSLWSNLRRLSTSQILLGGILSGAGIHAIISIITIVIPIAAPGQMRSFSLWSNLRRLSTSQILLGGILSGAGIHAIISIITIVIPIAAPGLALSTRDVGYLLAAFAFTQFIACLWLSAHPDPTKLCRRLFLSLIVGGIVMTTTYCAVGFYSLLLVQFIACLWLSAHPDPTKLCRRLFLSLIVGGIVMTTTYCAVGFYSLLLVKFIACLWLSAHPDPTKLCRRLFLSLIVGGIVMTTTYCAVGFYSLLLVSMIVGAALGLVHPLSMSIIFQYSEPGAVGRRRGRHRWCTPYA